MNWENLRTCCLKGLKHGETTCPVCGRKLVIEDYHVKPTTNGLKATLLIPLFALTLNSCNETETGIVKDKIDGKVYLTPVDDTTKVYRVINFNKAYKDFTTENIYLNMNKGDTVVYGNSGKHTEIIPSEYSSALFGGGAYYKISCINSVHIYKLPNLVKKTKEEEAIRKLQEEYNNIRHR